MAHMLNHLKIIDAASFLAGPGAATVLADYGADVIKIEPLAGDGYRTLSRPHRTDYNWQLTSRNKRSLALDLNAQDGRDLLHRLIDDADVLIVNFFDDQLARYQLEYESLQTRNPGLIYARMSGFGTTGPEARKRGFDSTGWWARTGMMDMVRDQGQPPVMGAPGFGDHSSAMSLFSAIMLGLYRRERSGEGCAVETSLLANGIWANGMQVQGAIAGRDLNAIRQEKGFQNPLTSVYETADGRHVLLAAINSAREWPALCEAVDKMSWRDTYPDLRAVMRDRLTILAEVSRIVKGWTLEETRGHLEAVGITYSVVQNLQEVIEDEQARAAGIVLETGSDDPDYQLTVSSPIAVAEEDKRPPGPAPEIGEHSREILAEVGLSEKEIQRLVDESVIAEPDQD